MENESKILNDVEQAYGAMNILTRYPKLANKHQNLASAITRMDKRKNLAVLKKLGYTFKIFSPGQHYNFEEVNGPVRLVLSFQISGGIITSCIYITRLAV